jgi:hypothetical protein
MTIISLVQNDVYVIFCPLSFARDLLALTHMWMCVKMKAQLLIQEQLGNAYGI